MRLGMWLAMECTNCGTPLGSESSDHATEAKICQEEYKFLPDKNPDTEVWRRCTKCGQLYVRTVAEIQEEKQEEENDSVDS